MVLLSRKKKILIRCVLIIAIVAGVIGLAYILAVPKTRNKNITLYQSNLQPMLNYEVHLVDNDIYNDSIQPENEAYIKKMVDYIKVNFGTNYQVDTEADLKMEYELSAKVIGYSSGTDTRTDYWVKDFPILGKKSVKIHSNGIQKEESFNLNLKEYDDFAVHANNFTEVNLSTELIVSMIGSIVTDTPKGSMDTPFDINMTIPLNGGDFSITKGDLQPITKKITETKKIILHPNVKVIAFIIIAIITSIILLVCSFFFVREPGESDIVRKEVGKLIKNYGSRMVSMNHKPLKIYNLSYEVRGIKDLIILSDEIHKPIYYISDHDNIIKDNSFYVDDGDDLYLYKVKCKNDFYLDYEYIENPNEIQA